MARAKLSVGKESARITSGIMNDADWCRILSGEMNEAEMMRITSGIIDDAEWCRILSGEMNEAEDMPERIRQNAIFD